MQALDALQRSFAEPTSPFNGAALDNASRPAFALSPPEKKRKWENSQDDAEQDECLLPRASSVSEGVEEAAADERTPRESFDRHEQGARSHEEGAPYSRRAHRRIWTTALELRAAHVLLDETDEEDGEEDETTIITTFVSSAISPMTSKLAC